MHGMGVLYGSDDLNLLHGYLQRHQGSIGLVFTGLDSLLKSRDDESRFLDYLESLVNSASQMQIILVVHKELKETRASMVRYTLESCDSTKCKTWMQRQLKRHSDEATCMETLVDNTCHPLCLDLMCTSVRMGESTAKELGEAVESDFLSTLIAEINIEPLTALQPKEQRFG